MSCHFPWSSLGYIDKVNGTPQWIIFPYANPLKFMLENEKTLLCSTVATFMHKRNSLLEY